MSAKPFGDSPLTLASFCVPRRKRLWDTQQSVENQEFVLQRVPEQQQQQQQQATGIFGHPQFMHHHDDHNNSNQPLYHQLSSGGIVANRSRAAPLDLTTTGGNMMSNNPPAPFDPSQLDPIFQNCPDPSQCVNNVQYRRLYVGHLDESIDAEIIKQIFKSFGVVDNVEYHPPKNQAPGGRATGFCFVQFNKHQSVYDALACMGAYQVRGKTFKVSLPNSVQPIDPNFNAEQYFDQNFDALMEKWQSAVKTGQSLSLLGNDPNSQRDYERLLNYYKNKYRNRLAGPTTTATTAEPAQPQGYKVYVGGGFTESMNEDLLRTVFEPFGVINSVTLVRNVDGTLKGYGFIEFRDKASADNAILHLDGRDYADKKLTVSEAKTERTTQENLVPLDFDLNYINIPDPLEDKYPSLTIPACVEPRTCIRIDGMYTVTEWNGLTPQQQQEELANFRQDMSIYGALADTDIRLERYNKFGVPCEQESPCVVACVKFTSLVGADRCYRSLTNRLFDGHAIIVRYVKQIVRTDSDGRLESYY